MKKWKHQCNGFSGWVEGLIDLEVSPHQHLQSEKYLFLLTESELLIQYISPSGSRKIFLSCQPSSRTECRRLRSQLCL